MSTPASTMTEAVPSPWASVIRLRIAPAILLAVTTFFVYHDVVQHPFSNYDDGEYVVDNGNIHAGITRSSVRWALLSIEHANWHPVTWLSHALDWQLFGSVPAGHHFISLLLHVGNGALLFLFLAWVTRSIGRSLLIAALFALHPINVESVAWIAERKNVLCTFFFLLTLLAYAWYVRRPNVRRYLVFTAAFVLGLAAKPMLVTVPFVLLLLDYWPFQRIREWSASPVAGDLIRTPNLNASFTSARFPFWKLALEKLPLLVLSAADSFLTLIAQRRVDAIRSAVAFPFPLRLENAIVSYASYLWKTVCPTRLAVLYPFPTAGIPWWQLAPSAFLLMSVTMLVWRKRSRHAYLLTGWLWYLGMLVPVIGLIQVGDQGMADRYAYLPLIGIFLIVVWGFAESAEKIGTQVRWFLPTAALTALGILGFLTWRQVGFWRSNLDLWSHTAAVTENNWSAEDVVGSELLIQAVNSGAHSSNEAQIHFQRAVAINPKDSEAIMNIGADLQLHGQVGAALEKYKLALQYVQDDFLKTKILSDMGWAYEQLGQFLTARECYQKAMQMTERADPAAFVGFARTFTDEKIAALAQTLIGKPTAEGYLDLGQLQDEGGYTTAARASYQRALEMEPQLEAARVALAHDSNVQR